MVNAGIRTHHLNITGFDNETIIHPIKQKFPYLSVDGYQIFSPVEQYHH